MNAADAEVQEEVDRLFDRFERMTDAEFMMLAAVWDEGDPIARQDAWTLVKVALKATKRDRLLDDARNRIAAWVNNYGYRNAYPDTMGPLGTSGMDAGSVRRSAIPPMLDAIAATITQDRLDVDERWVLTKPIEAIAR